MLNNLIPRGYNLLQSRDGTGTLGHGSVILAVVRSWVNVSGPVFDPVLSFNMIAHL